MFYKLLPFKIWLVGLLFIAGLSLAFYFVLNRGAKSSIVGQQLHLEETITTAQATNIVYYFRKLGNSVASLAQYNSLGLRNASTAHDLNVFFEQRHADGLIDGIELTDGDGVIRFGSGATGSRNLGRSLAGTDYFLWANGLPGRGDYFVGHPRSNQGGGSEGEVVVPVAAPVYQNGVLGGVLVATVKLGPLAERYFKLMKTTDQTHMYLTDSEGEIIYTDSDSDRFGISVHELFPNLEVNTSEHRALESGSNLVAYSQVQLNSQNWLLVSSSPVNDIEALARPIYVQQISMLILASLSILLFGIMASREK